MTDAATAVRLCVTRLRRLGKLVGVREWRGWRVVVCSFGPEASKVKAVLGKELGADEDSLGCVPYVVPGRTLSRRKAKRVRSELVTAGAEVRLSRAMCRIVLTAAAPRAHELSRYLRRSWWRHWPSRMRLRSLGDLVLMLEEPPLTLFEGVSQRAAVKIKQKLRDKFSVQCRVEACEPGFGLRIAHRGPYDGDRLREALERSSVWACDSAKWVSDVEADLQRARLSALGAEVEVVSVNDCPGGGKTECVESISASQVASLGGFLISLIPFGTQVLRVNESKWLAWAMIVALGGSFLNYFFGAWYTESQHWFFVKVRRPGHAKWEYLLRLGGLFYLTLIPAVGAWFLSKIPDSSNETFYLPLGLTVSLLGLYVVFLIWDFFVHRQLGSEFVGYFWWLDGLSLFGAGLLVTISSNLWKENLQAIGLVSGVSMVAFLVGGFLAMRGGLKDYGVRWLRALVAVVPGVTARGVR